jgi:hypothetical protein
MMRVDRHLAGCAVCRAQVVAGRHRSADTAALGAVVTAGAHVGYEQMQSYVDGRLTAVQKAAVDAHTMLCPMCRDELADLARHAPALRQPAAARPAAPRHVGFGRWWQWLPGVAVAAFVGTVAITVVLQDRVAEREDTTMQSAAGARSGKTLSLRHDALEALEPLSPAAAVAWRARDYPRLVTLLRPLADQRQPLALSALASLYAQGLGVAQDLRQAEQLWQRAADLGQPGARENAEAVRRHLAADR